MELRQNRDGKQLQLYHHRRDRGRRYDHYIREYQSGTRVNCKNSIDNSMK